MNTALPLPPAQLPGREELARRSVLVMGDAMLNRYWLGTVDRISPEAPVPVLRVIRQVHRPGGAAHVALNVRTLGARSTLLAACGDDEPGHMLDRLLISQGVNVAMEHDAAVRTLVKLRTEGRSQPLLRTDYEARPCADTLARLRQRFDMALLNHDAVILSDHGNGCLADAAATHAIVAVARAHGRPVLVVPHGLHWERYTGASVFAPHRAELAQALDPWSSESMLQEQALALRHRLQFDSVLLARCEIGMTLFDAQGALHVDACSSEVHDAAGPSDTATVIAALAVLMSGGLSARAALPLAVANSADGMGVGRFGTATLWN